MPMKPAAPVTRTFFIGSLLLSPAQLDQLGVLHVAVHAADRDMQEARHAVEEAQAQDVELEKAHEGRQHEMQQVAAAAQLERLARGEGGVAVLAIEVSADVVER